MRVYVLKGSSVQTVLHSMFQADSCKARTHAQNDDVDEHDDEHDEHHADDDDDDADDDARS